MGFVNERYYSWKNFNKNNKKRMQNFREIQLGRFFMHKRDGGVIKAC